MRRPKPLKERREHRLITEARLQGEILTLKQLLRQYAISRVYRPHVAGLAVAYMGTRCNLCGDEAAPNVKLVHVWDCPLHGVQPGSAIPVDRDPRRRR